MQKLRQMIDQAELDPTPQIFQDIRLYLNTLELASADKLPEGYEECQECGEPTWNIEYTQCEKCGFAD